MSAAEARGARPDEVDRAIECCGAAFGGKDAQRAAHMTDFFARIHKEDPNFRPENSRVVLFNGRIVSVVQIFERETLIGGVPVKMGGLGSVGTLPQFRRRGFGTLALQDALRFMEREGYDLSLLFTGIHDYYAREGWRVFEHASALTASVPQGLANDGAGGRRPVRWPEELPALMRLYNQFNRGATGPIQRSEAYWLRHVRWRPFEERQFTAAYENGRMVAYLRYSGDGMLEEAAYVQGGRAAAAALAVEALRGREQTRVMPGALTLRRGLEGRGFAFQEEPLRWLMFRIVNLKSLLKKLAPGMAERLQNSPASEWGADAVRRIRIEAELTEPAELKIDGGSVEVVDGDPSDEGGLSIRLKLTHAEAIDLVLGQLPVETALPIGVSDEAREAVKSLFPMQRYVWHSRDNF